MRILGIHDCFDAGAALVEDGRLVAAVNEERLNRIKYFHEPTRRFLRVFNITTGPAFPELSIQSCLKLGGIGLQDLDAIALVRTTRTRILKRRLLDVFRYDPVMALRTLPNAGYDLPNRLTSMGNITRGSDRRLRSLGIRFEGSPRSRSDGLVRARPGHPGIVEVSHHLCHAASALRTSGWRDALVVTTDMEGEMISTTVWEARGGRLTAAAETAYQLASAGVFYGVVTAELGFRMHQDEWKLMGLAAYGDPTKLDGAFDDALSFDRNRGMLRSRVEAFRLRRHVRRLLRSHSREDVAALAQARLEEVFVELAQHWVERSGLRRIALAGGVAHNVKMNGRLRDLDEVEAVYAFPHPGDGGLAAGAALEAHAHLGGKPDSVELPSVYLGPEFDGDRIRAAAAAAGVPIERQADIAGATADLLAEGKVLGWFQGRMEYGPRALGARSILVHPGSAEHRDRVNAAVKFREHWRPFALSVLGERADEVLENACSSPFMTMGFTVKRVPQETLAAITHVDGTTRPQTVTAEANPRYHALLSAFHERTGLPGVLNTSFNRAGEPIVCSPEDAFACYLGCGMEALAIGDFLAVKKEN